MLDSEKIVLHWDDSLSLSRIPVLHHCDDASYTLRFAFNRFNAARALQIWTHELLFPVRRGNEKAMQRCVRLFEAVRAMEEEIVASDEKGRDEWENAGVEGIRGERPIDWMVLKRRKWISKWWVVLVGLLSAVVLLVAIIAAIWVARG